MSPKEWTENPSIYFLSDNKPYHVVKARYWSFSHVENNDSCKNTQNVSRERAYRAPDICVEHSIQSKDC